MKLYYVKNYDTIYELKPKDFDQYLKDVVNDCEDDLGYYGSIVCDINIDATDINPTIARNELKDLEEYFKMKKKETRHVGL